MTAIENERIEFKVNVIGTPVPQISWFKDGFEIFSSRRTKITVDNNISTLIIHQAALTDEGEIKCTATNRAGHVVSRAKLKIEAPPKIRLPRQYEDGLIIEADEVVRLKVGIAGRPPPIVQWSHNGEIIENDKRHEIETTDKNSSLKISNSQRSDRGEYHIKAINSLGDDNAYFLVTVTAKPQPPGKVAITMSLGKSVTLSWTAPEDDGGCKIGNYIVEYFRQGWNVWLKAATTRQLSTTLNDLIEGSEYKFRVKAENPYGLSDPSEESDVIFIPDPKRGIMTQSDKPKSNENLIENDTNIQSPPRRKHDTKNLIDIKIPNNKLTKQHAIHPSPEILDTEQISNVISYGASDAVYRKISQEFLNEPFTKKSKENLITKSPVPIRKSPTPPPLQPPIKPPRSPLVKKKLTPPKEEDKENDEDINEKTRNIKEEIKTFLEPNTNPTEGLNNSSEFVLVLYPEKESKNDDDKSKIKSLKKFYFCFLFHHLQ